MGKKIPKATARKNPCSVFRDEGKTGMGEEPDLVTFQLQFLREMSQEVWDTYLTFSRLEWSVVASKLSESVSS